MTLSSASNFAVRSPANTPSVYTWPEWGAPGQWSEVFALGSVHSGRGYAGAVTPHMEPLLEELEDWEISAANALSLIDEYIDDLPDEDEEG